MSINRHITHIKSKVIENGAPKLPTASDLHEGEIAVNYAKGYETLSIKNESGDVVTFKTKEYNDANYASKSSEHTHSNKTALDSITGNVGTMAYQNANNYSSATEVSTAFENVVKDASYVHTDNNFTTTLKDKLDGIAANAEVNVQADWNETGTTSDSYIQNKPTLGTAAAKGVSNGITNSDNLIEAKHIYSGVGVTIGYDSNSKKVQLKNASGSMLSEFDASAFIVDGMVENVEIKNVTSSGTCLVVSFNTDAGKQDINIPISQIFDASNYYTTGQTSGATQISTALNSKANTATTLAGYNISDAKIENGTITLGNNTITPLTSVTIPVTSVTTSSTNGNISVNGSNVAVHGLRGAAYLNTGTTANTVAAGNHTHNEYEPAVNYVYSAITGNINSFVSPIASGSTNNGKQANVLFYNSSSSKVTVTIPTTYKTPTGAAVSIDIPASGYGEVNCLVLDSKIFVRGV